MKTDISFPITNIGGEAMKLMLKDMGFYKNYDIPSGIRTISRLMVEHLQLIQDNNDVTNAPLLPR